MNSFVASWAIAAGIAVLAVAVIGSILLHRRAKQLERDPKSSSSSLNNEGAAPSPPSETDRATGASAEAPTDSSSNSSKDASQAAQAEATQAEAGTGKQAGKSTQAQEALESEPAPEDQDATDTQSASPASAGTTEGEADQSAGAASSNETDSQTEQYGEGASDDVVVQAAQAQDAFDLERTIRKLRGDYWASRWLLGEEATDDLRQALGKARGIAASCLADTTVFEDGTVSFPPGCNRLNSVIAATEEPARPLRALCATKFIHAIAAYRANPPEDVNPHRAAIRAGRYVSPDPTYGLHRLISEVEVGLSHARLEIAKVSPTAGSATSSLLRSGLSDATAHLRKATEALAQLDAPTPDDIHAIEADLLRAVWWRRFIDLSVKFLSQKEWAQTSTDRGEWTRLAVLASRLTHVLVDLNQDLVEPADITRLAGAQILIDQGSKADRRDVPVRTARQVVETCEQLVNKLSTSANK